MNRILKKGGMLLTSSDYWPNRFSQQIISKDIRKMSPNNVFSKEKIEKDVIKAPDTMVLLLLNRLILHMKIKLYIGKAGIIHFNLFCIKERKNKSLDHLLP